MMRKEEYSLMTSFLLFRCVDFSEPVDVRKSRALTLENMKLAMEVERLKGHRTRGRTSCSRKSHKEEQTWWHVKI